MNAIADLEFFVRLVRHGSLSSLARDLGVTPPAVSARLALLENGSVCGCSTAPRDVSR